VPSPFAVAIADALELSWAATARQEQRMPPGDDWFCWLYEGGRGAGKTRSGSEATGEEARSGRAKRIALVAPTAADARDTMIEGESGILACSPNWCRPVYEPSRRRLTWPNGAIATTFSAEEAERLRGPQHDFAWCDELAAWRDLAAWDMLQFGLRLGRRPRCIVTTTPKPTKLFRDLLARPDVVVTHGSTYDNRANLAPAFFDQIIRKYEGTRLGRQELMAELLIDVPGALWTASMLERDGFRVARALDLTRVVVAIDPAVTSGENADETGIVVAGRDSADRAFVIADLSGRMSAFDWARTAVRAYHEFEADRIVAEVNNGGELVENTLRMVDPSVSFRAVRASRGKVARAEPAAALYEQGRVHHVGQFSKLEDQMLSFTSDFDRSRAGYSPDRVDALVWALTDLLISPMKDAGLYEYYRLMSQQVNERRKSEEQRLPYRVIT
jgi:phage terminase large subunit-like protein